MAFTYNRLWKILIDQGLTKEQFRKQTKLSPTTVAAMGRGEGISPKVLERICRTLRVQPGDIMELAPETEESL